jgi:hypothetical protein
MRAERTIEGIIATAQERRKAKKPKEKSKAR